MRRPGRPACRAPGRSPRAALGWAPSIACAIAPSSGSMSAQVADHLLLGYFLAAFCRERARKIVNDEADSTATYSHSHMPRTALHTHSKSTRRRQGGRRARHTIARPSHPAPNSSLPPVHQPDQYHAPSDRSSPSAPRLSRMPRRHAWLAAYVFAWLIAAYPGAPWPPSFISTRDTAQVRGFRLPRCLPGSLSLHTRASATATSVSVQALHPSTSSGSPSIQSPEPPRSKRPRVQFSEPSLAPNSTKTGFVISSRLRASSRIPSSPFCDQEDFSQC